MVADWDVFLWAPNDRVLAFDDVSFFLERVELPFDEFAIAWIEVSSDKLPSPVN